LVHRSVNEVMDHLGSHTSSGGIYAVSGVPEEALLSMGERFRTRGDHYNFGHDVDHGRSRLFDDSRFQRHGRRQFVGRVCARRWGFRLDSDRASSAAAATSSATAAASERQPQHGRSGVSRWSESRGRLSSRALYQDRTKNRGVKGLKNWMKKKRLLQRRAKQQQQQHHISAELQLKQQQHQQEIVREDKYDAMSASQPSTTRLDEDILSIATVDSSPSRKQKSKTKKKNRLPWLREIESTRSAGTSASSPIVKPPHSSSSLETTTAPRLPEVFPPRSPPPATIAEHASLTFPTTRRATVPHDFNRQSSIAAEASFVGTADQPYLFIRSRRLDR
jgi:hypothetical protein